MEDLTITVPMGAMQRVGIPRGYQVGSLTGIGARKRQEDAFAVANAFDVKAIRDKGLLFVVCDGMGGMKDGKIASTTAIASISRAFANSNNGHNLRQSMRQAVIDASEEVRHILQGEGGCTVVACVIHNNRLHFVSVGDSFLFLKRGDRLYRLNQEHTVKSFTHLSQIDAGNVDPRYGRQARMSVALTRFVGMEGFDGMDGTVRPIRLHSGDVLMACSDGVGGVLSEEQVISALGKNSPNDIVAAIERDIIFGGRANQDNYTAVVVRCVE